MRVQALGKGKNLFHIIFGGNDAEVTPVPIPNTEVKLCSADGTWWEAAWESRSLPEQKRTLMAFFFCSVLFATGEYIILKQSFKHHLTAYYILLRKAPQTRFCSATLKNIEERLITKIKPFICVKQIKGFYITTVYNYNSLIMQFTSLV